MGLIFKDKLFNCTWEEVGVMRNVRRHHGMCAVDGVIYIFGGVGKYRILMSSVESFDTEEGRYCLESH